MEHNRGLRVGLLGGFQISVDGRPVEPSAWRLRKAQDLVKVLALSPGRRLLRDQVLEVLWPGRDPDSASNNLHQVLHAARQAIESVGGDGRSCLTLKAETVHLCPDGRIEVDADEFEAAARAALASGERSDCERALDLCTGKLLPEDRYADWARDRRDTLQRLKADVIFGLASRLEESGHLTAAADMLDRLVLDDATEERAHRALIRVRARAGDRTAAIRQYQVLERVLDVELGVAPDPRSTDLVDAVRSGHIGPPDDEGWDSGPPTNLGQPLSSFVGREQELTELGALTRETRLVTLVGAGGCGKTRLALEVGRRELQHFSGGTFLVELAPVSQAHHVAQETMRTLDVRRGPDQTEQQAICSWVGARASLMIFDNCEHVAHEAAIVIGALLRSCPRLRVLSTSREPLRVPGEVVRRVPSLQLPDPGLLPSLTDLRGSDAVALFAERARDVQPDFEVDERNAADVTAVCVRLDGLPLALELAAARVHALGVSGLARNLDDRFRILNQGPPSAPTHHRTLEATVQWSFDLLSEDEKALFVRLSVFHGPFDLDAAQAIAPESLGGMVAPLVSRLVDQSLVMAKETDGTVQYRLLETLRAYGLDRLRSKGELDNARTRHANWLQQLVGSSASHADVSERTALVSRLGLAHDELAPALDHLLARDPRAAARLACQLWPYWLWRAHLGEGLSVIERVLEHVTGPSIERAALLTGAAALSFRWKGFAEMERYAVLSRQEAAALGDVDGLCRALIFCAAGPFNRDEFDAAQASFMQALQLAHTHQRPGWEISARLGLAMLAAAQLQFPEAADQLARAEALVSESQHTLGVVDIYTLGAWMPTRRGGERLHMLSETFIPFEDGMRRAARASILLARGNLERLSGRFDRSASSLTAALQVNEHVGDDAGQALALSWLGQLAFDEGDFETAERLLTRSLLIRRRIRHMRGVVITLISLGRVAAERGQIDTAGRLLAEAEQLCRKRADRVGTAMILAQQAQVEIASGSPEKAVTTMSEALPMLVNVGGYGVAIACALRDLGEAQVLAGMAVLGGATLAEAADGFDRSGYAEEAQRCRKLSSRSGRSDE